jgi:uncharacterized protein YjbJ (UPF0337 family)
MSSSNNPNKDATSTLQSYVDTATGAVQSALGSLTGSTSDRVSFFACLLNHTHMLTCMQTVGEQKKSVADAEKDLSHSSAKIGGVTATPGGGLAVDDPNRAAGSWNQTVGSAKEFTGNLVGADGLKQEGIRQNKEGQGQEAEGQLKDLGQGIQDRVGGTVGSAVAGLTGNTAAKAQHQQQHDDGKARQRGVETDLQKQAPQ